MEGEHEKDIRLEGQDEILKYQEGRKKVIKAEHKKKCSIFKFAICLKLQLLQSLID